MAELFRWGVVLARLDEIPTHRRHPDIPSSKVWSRRGEQIRMTGREDPRSGAAHRFSGEVNAAVVHAQAIAGFRETMQHIPLPYAEVLSVAPRERLDVDHVVMIRDRAVSLVHRPPFHIHRVGGIETMKIDDDRPLPR